MDVARLARTTWFGPMVLALALRLWGLGELPVSLTGDEARLGYEAWSIVRTGHDTGGRPWPLVAGPDGWLDRPLGTYAVAVTIASLGPTALAVRLPFAIVGAVSVLPAAVVGEALFGSRVAGVGAGLVLAISTWHLAFTRVARDGAWLVLGLLVMVAGIVRASNVAPSTDASGRRTRDIATAMILAVTGAVVSTAGDMNGAVAAAATAIAVGIAIGWTAAPRSLVGVVVGASLAVAIGTAALLATGSRGMAVGPTTGAFDGASAKSARRLAADPTGTVGALQSAVMVLARDAMDAYASHFDPTFLFTRGDRDARNHASGSGQLSLVDAPLVAGGLALALASARRSGRERARGRPAGWAVVVAWLMAAPLPAMLAVSAADAARSVAMVPALALLEAGAVAAAWPWLARRRVTLEVAVAVACSLGAWAVATATHDRVEAGRAWNVGAVDGFSWARGEIDEGRATEVVVVGASPDFLAHARFVLRIDPAGERTDPVGEAGAGTRIVGFPGRNGAIDWSATRARDRSGSRIYAIEGAEPVPDGFAEARVARTGDGRPVVTFVRATP